MSRRLLTAITGLLIGPLVAGCGVLPGTKGTPAPSAVPTLAAGPHSSTVFQPPISFTVPDGWTNPVDNPAYFELAPVSDQNSGIHFFHDWQAMAQDKSCSDNPAPGIGVSSTERCSGSAPSRASR